MLQLRLLLFALQTALTTAVCIVEYSFWPELSAAEKSNLGKLYIPYFVFGESDSFLFPLLLSIGEGKEAEVERLSVWGGLLILNGQPW